MTAPTVTSFVDNLGRTWSTTDTARTTSLAAPPVNKDFELKYAGKECYPLDGANGDHEEHLGEDKTPEECSKLCDAKAGCNWFVVGTHGGAGKGSCYWEYDDACKHSQVDAPYTVYKRILKTKVTPKYGGNGGRPVKSSCTPGAHITKWLIRSGSLVDQIVGVCSDGKKLKKCGGNGGGKHTVKAKNWVSVKTGGLVDQFAGKGGHGGGHHKLDCGEGMQATGVKFRCGALVDAVQLECTETA